MPEVSKCRSCGAAIVWCLAHTTGKLMPLDAAPDPNGNVLLKEDGTYKVLSLSMFDDQDWLRHKGHWVRHKSHFATCEHSGDWRKKK